jgi:hypothetical protein
MATVNANHIAAKGGTFEPQRTNNFLVEIAGLEGDDQNYLVLSTQAITLPNETSELIEVRYMNEVRKVAGQTTHEDISWTIRDWVDVAARDALMRWRRQVANPETGGVGLASTYKKEGSVVFVGPDGVTERVMALQGVWPQSIAPGSFDHESSDKVIIEVTLAIDKAVYELA